jgi:hypothetical protein
MPDLGLPVFEMNHHFSNTGITLNIETKRWRRGANTYVAAIKISIGTIVLPLLGLKRMYGYHQYNGNNKWVA